MCALAVDGNAGDARLAPAAVAEEAARTLLVPRSPLPLAADADAADEADVDDDDSAGAVR